MSLLPVRTRIAPTPSGYLHMGNLYSFVLTWLIAKSKNGTICLRIDDLDATRIRREYVEDIFSVLDFVGLQPDEGSSGADDFFRNYSQQNRISEYHSVINRLKEAGFLYACQCTRKQIMGQNTDGLYGGVCRNLKIDFEKPDVSLRVALGPGSQVSLFDSLRLATYKVDLASEMGDFVIRRKDKIPAYQIASLADDLAMGINLVVRGVDLLPSSAAQCYLASLLGKPEFTNIHWYHHALIMNKSAQKLSKSAGHDSIKWMIENGLSRTELLGIMANYCGLPPKKYSSLDDLGQEFTFSGA